MKKFLAVFIAVMMALTMGVMLVACNPTEEKDPNAEALNAPVIAISGKVISWSEVAHADEYEIYQDEKKVATQGTTSYSISETKAGTYKFKVKATSDDKMYKDSEFSNEVEYTVVAKAPEAKQLAKPVVKLQGNVLSWEAVPNAEEYEIYSNGEMVKSQTTTSYTIVETEVGSYDYTVKATSTSANFTDSALSDKVTYKVEKAPEVDGVTLTSLLKNIDLTKGLTINGTSDFDILGAIIGMQGQNAAQKINETTNVSVKANIADKQFNLDTEVNANVGPLGDVLANIYMRGDKIYVGDAEVADKATFDASKIIYEEKDVSQMGVDINDIIVNSLPTALSGLDRIPLAKFLNSKVVFAKQGNDLVAVIDIVDILTKLVNKVEAIVAELNVNSTVEDIYTLIEGDEILSAVFGEMPATELYATVRTALTSANPEMAEMLPETLDDKDETPGFISMINGLFASKGSDYEFPAAGNMTVVQYAAAAVEAGKDWTLGDMIPFFMEFIPGQGDAGNPNNDQETGNVGEATNPGREEMNGVAPAADLNTMLESIKTMVSGYTAQLKVLLPLNTLKITIKASTAGNLASIKVDAKVDANLLALFGGSGEGDEPSNEVDKNMQASDPEITATPVIEGSVNLEFTYGTVVLKDTSELLTVKKAVAPLVGTYNLTSVKEEGGETEIAGITGTLVIDENGVITVQVTDNSEEYHIGDIVDDGTVGRFGADGTGLVIKYGVFEDRYTISDNTFTLKVQANKMVEESRFEDTFIVLTFTKAAQA